MNDRTRSAGGDKYRTTPAHMRSVEANGEAVPFSARMEAELCERVLGDRRHGL